MKGLIRKLMDEKDWSLSTALTLPQPRLEIVKHFGFKIVTIQATSKAQIIGDLSPSICSFLKYRAHMDGI